MLIEKFKLFMMNLEILLINFLGVKLVKLVACGSEIDSSTLRINVDVLSSCHELPVFSKKLKYRQDSFDLHQVLYRQPCKLI